MVFALNAYGLHMHHLSSLNQPLCFALHAVVAHAYTFIFSLVAVLVYACVAQAGY